MIRCQMMLREIGGIRWYYSNENRSPIFARLISNPNNVGIYIMDKKDKQIASVLIDHNNLHQSGTYVVFFPFDLGSRIALEEYMNG